MEITYLEKQNCKPYSGIAHDGTNYYLSAGDKIYSFDSDYEYIETFFCRRCYSQLAYDSYDSCFYAISSESPHKIFKLNSKLAEVDFVIMREFVTSISFNNSQNKLIYANETSVFSYDKDGQKSLILSLPKALISSIYISETNGAITFSREKRHYANIYDFTENTVDMVTLPKGYIPSQLLNANEILVSKCGDYSYILKIFSENLIEEGIELEKID